MEIKIQCDCGQRYKLDVEPVNGVMPFTVNCPVCAADGTEKGNVLIQQALAQSPVPMAPPVAAASGRLRINLAPAHVPEPAPAPVAEAGVTNPPTFAPGRIGSVSAANSADATAVAPRKPNFGLGLLGGVCGALVGAILYFVIVKTTGIRLSYFAIGVGGLAGWLADVCGKGEGSKELAGITAVCTVGFIVGAQYLLALGWWQTELGADFNQPVYDREVKHAQLAVKMIPTGSDTEIRNYLVADQSSGDLKVDPATVSADDIKQFHDQVLPQYQDLASGKITRDQYNTQNGIDAVKDKQNADTADGTFKAYFIIKLIRWSNLVSLAAAAGLAFRLCANA